jgi:hypothetical protein
MTKLCEMIMECTALKGMDRLVLYGWASQLEEGNDTPYCSKERWLTSSHVRFPLISGRVNSFTTTFDILFLLSLKYLGLGALAIIVTKLL